MYFESRVLFFHHQNSILVGFPAPFPMSSRGRWLNQPENTWAAAESLSGGSWRGWIMWLMILQMGMALWLKIIDLHLAAPICCRWIVARRGNWISLSLIVSLDLRYWEQRCFRMVKYQKENCRRSSWHHSVCWPVSFCPNLYEEALKSMV